MQTTSIISVNDIPKRNKHRASVSRTLVEQALILKPKQALRVNDVTLNLALSLQQYCRDQKPPIGCYRRRNDESPDSFNVYLVRK